MLGYFLGVLSVFVEVTRTYKAIRISRSVQHIIRISTSVLAQFVPYSYNEVRKARFGELADCNVKAGIDPFGYMKFISETIHVIAVSIGQFIRVSLSSGQFCSPDAQF